MSAQQWWDDVITKRGGRRENELKEGLHSLRGVCLRSFPEFIADIKLVSVRPSEAQIAGTGVAELTINVSGQLKITSRKFTTDLMTSISL